LVPERAFAGARVFFQLLAQQVGSFTIFLVFGFHVQIQHDGAGCDAVDVVVFNIILADITFVSDETTGNFFGNVVVARIGGNFSQFSNGTNLYAVNIIFELGFATTALIPSIVVIVQGFTLQLGIHQTLAPIQFRISSDRNVLGFVTQSIFQPNARSGGNACNFLLQISH